MTRLQVFIVIAALVFVLASGLFYFRAFLEPQKGTVFVDASPRSQVYVNGQLVGTTPFEGRFVTGEATIRLLPESLGIALSPYETRVALTPGVKTIVRRFFGPTEEESGGEVLSFEKYGGEEASISVVTIPDSAQIKIDGTPRGFAPVKIPRIAPGEHTLSIVATGYLSSTFSVMAQKGYQLTVVSKLGRDPNPSTIPSPSPTPAPKKTLVILDTPTGFLRVRTEPAKTASEIGQVKPGADYAVLGSENGWYKIEYQGGKEGWVSGEFVKIQ